MFSVFSLAFLDTNPLPSTYKECPSNSATTATLKMFTKFYFEMLDSVFDQFTFCKIEIATKGKLLDRNKLFQLEQL
jgi:hypothetical protein